MQRLASSVRGRLGKVSIFRALRHRDFFLLWIGGLFSFTGSQVQNVAQGYWVYEQTGSEAKLAMVMFAFTLPIMLLAPFSGVIADTFNRRSILATTMIVNALGAFSLGVAFFMGALTYEHILVVSAIQGIMQTAEGPTRQSVVRTIVGDEDLPAAVPAMSMTFNIARIVGPAIGGLIAASFDVGICFVVNAVSFSALIAAVFAIRTNLEPMQRRSGSTFGLVKEGWLYVLRHSHLKVLFLMESATSIFALFYMSLMPAIAKSMLDLDERGLGLAMSFIGGGALLGLLVLAGISHRPFKPLITRLAMTSAGVGLVCLGFMDESLRWLAFPLFSLMGASTIMQFNTTNTLFQLMSPDKLRGRVIALHLWALAGLSPIGIFFFGWLAESASLNFALWTGGALMLLSSIAAWIYGRQVKDPSGQMAGAS